MQKLNTLLFLFMAAIAQAQNCGNPQSQIDIQGNNIRARILTGGDLFTDLDGDALFEPNPGPPGSISPGTIYAAGIWMGGVDPGGNLKLAAVDYRSASRRDYSAGPLQEDGTTSNFDCANWDRHFRVTRAEVMAFFNAPPTDADALKSQFPAIAGWPARGNPYFQDMHGFDLPFSIVDFAGFMDVNGDNLYDPLDGDYPVVKVQGKAPFLPAEFIWCVFNDAGSAHTETNGKSLQMEVQLTVWAFNCSDHPVLNNAIFTAHKLINKATEPLDSTFLGIWTDVDLGCYEDDYVGCDPELNTMYAYNMDAIDGSQGNFCSGGVQTFSGTAPVQSVTLLNHPLDKFIPYNSNGSNSPSGTFDPTTPAEFYNYLTGSWRDGSPLTDAPGGYGPGNKVNYLYPDDPANPNGWSMCTANLAPADRRMLGTISLGTMPPGAINEVVTAWAFHPNPELPCGLGSTFSDVEEIRNLYANEFAGICTFLKAPTAPPDSVDLFPNPSADASVLRYGKIVPQQLRIFDAAGRLVMEQNGGFAKEETVINGQQLASGIYALYLTTNEGIVVKKWAIAR